MDIITGKVVEGRGLGRKLGFPTINIPYTGDLRGVFAGCVILGERKFLAAVNVGARPTLNDDQIFCEACLINFKGEITGMVSIELVEKIRDIQKFENTGQLKLQIAKDIEFVKMKLC